MAHQPRSLAPFARPASFLSVNRRSIKSEEESPPRRRRQHLHTSPRIVTVEPDVRATINLSSSSRARTTRTTERDRRYTGEGEGEREREGKQKYRPFFLRRFIAKAKPPLSPLSLSLSPHFLVALSPCVPPRYTTRSGLHGYLRFVDYCCQPLSASLPPSLPPSPLPPTSLIVVVVVSCLLQRARPRFQQSLSLAFFLRPLCS